MSFFQADRVPGFDFEKHLIDEWIPKERSLEIPLYSWLPIFYIITGDIDKNGKFIGCWWLGFMIFGILLLLSALPLLLFPIKIKVIQVESWKQI